LYGAPKSYLVYFGTYTRNGSKGIYVSKLDAAKGSLSEPQLAAEVSNPSFVAIHPNGRNLYSVSESGGPGGPRGGVTSFSIDRASGKLTQINQASSGGAGPCHLNVDRTGRALAVVHYGSGRASCLPAKPAGSVGEPASFIQHAGSSVNPQRQQGPHAHSANFSPDNKFVIVCDLGLDEVLVYKVDPAGAKLTPNDPPFFKV